MTPMFVETQSSQGPESSGASQSGSMKGKLRATQTSLEFSQTQTPGTAGNPYVWQTSKSNIKLNVYLFLSYLGRRTAYNWLTGSSVDTLADYSGSAESLSSLLVFDKKSERQTAARRPVGEGFGLRRLTASTDEVDSRTRGRL